MLYARSCWRPAMELSADTTKCYSIYMIRVTSKVPHCGVLARRRHPQCTSYSELVLDTFNNLTMVMSGMLAIWSLSHSDNGTRIPCLDGFSWGTCSSINYQWYNDTERDWFKYQTILIIIIVKLHDLFNTCILLSIYTR